MTGVLGTLWKGGAVLLVAALVFLFTPALLGSLTGAVGIQLGLDKVLVVTLVATALAVGWYA